MPDNLREIMDEYERRRAQEDAKQSGIWGILNSSTGALMGATCAGGILWLFYCLDDVSSSPQGLWAILFRKLGEEGASRALVKAASWRLLPRDLDKDDPYLVIEPHEGLKFYTPVGLGPGIDTLAQGVPAFLDLGFGFVEVGPVGAGGAKAETVLRNLERRDASHQIAQFGLVGASVGGSQEELFSILSSLGPYLQLFVVDLASIPAGQRGEVAKIAKELVLKAMQLPGGGPRIFLRLPASWPDASASREEQRRAAGEVAQAARRSEAAGIIVCHDDAAYGCQGTKESRRLQRELISEAFEKTQGDIAIIASGGLRNARDALDAVEAGATVVQISTLLLEEGPVACRQMKDGMAQLLMQEGHLNLKSVVGSAVLRRTGKTKQKKRNPWKPKPT